jgi:hypothetical protein
MTASLRFRGLDVVIEALAPSLLPSLSLDSARLIGGMISALNAMVFCFSKLFRTVGLILPLLVFSCPEPDPPEEDA